MKKIALLLSMALVGALYAEVITFTKRVPVYKSVEVSRHVTRRVPYEECWEEEVPVYENSDDETVGAIIGGAAGGVLGHQIGGGSGKTAATVGGAIIGTLIGKNLANKGSHRDYRIVRRCRTRYKETGERIIEYKNYAKVMGHQIVRYSDKPLHHIRVRVTVEY
ncbi:hypothetical protein NitYY0826_C0416 [Nitratiruptor sp. YY08-26]|uniref:glycine zipper 2TM domain-containing protein n=1 Tax=unclassified Nitratiruptor TaxID=2624044 RepID=UPI00191589F8|nr:MULTISPECIES: glycine zipper 2TM domain-containing protein [unclassified Nitratiruptor]BCD61561.1 hypothetical protein NitYY0813_C0415 [Nitratiruptor sp. YY08-13]BCD65495.1 hypothetical protein NitYY0826_C0416 [Nitratiruptor sp. YY08-26]